MDLDYSDGNAIEAEIETLVSDADQLSSLHSIAADRYDEWPIRYHLSPERANLLRHLNFTGMDVLELGAGMGAVSRFLAESSKSLTVVEGTTQRFSVLSERLRDLSNWTGMVANIQDAVLEKKFDAVVVVGALEYSELFIKTEPGGSSPFETFIQKAKSFLKPEGVLILAIENQLGLKYLQGAPEDHTSYPYDGVAGYTSEKSPKTFSRKKLLALFESCGFCQFREFFPFPDYKLPSSVLSASLCLNEPSLSTELALHHPERDTSAFPTYLSTYSIAEAGLLPELANSFLVVACLTPGSAVATNLLPPPEQQAWHYSLKRRTPTCTRFIRDQGALFAEKISLLPEEPKSLVRWNPVARERVHSERPLRHELLRSGYFEGFDAWFSLWTRYLGWALKHFETPNGLRGEAVDAVFTNATIAKDRQTFQSFDLEWEWLAPVNPSWFILRNTLALFADHGLLPLAQGIQTLEALYKKACHDLGIEAALNSDLEKEAKLQSEITLERSCDKYYGALEAKVQVPLRRTHKREHIHEVSLNRGRLAKILNQFPDFLSALDRPTTRLFLTLDVRLRQSPIFRSCYSFILHFLRAAFRLLPSRYKVSSIKTSQDGTETASLTRVFGALPKAGWSLVEVDTQTSSQSVSSVDLQLTIRNRPFSVSLSKKPRSRFSRIIRIQEPAEDIQLVIRPANEASISRVATRNLLKVEVALRMIFPQLLKGFAWKAEGRRLREFWKQGRFRGAIAYIHTLVQKGDLGTVESYTDWLERYDSLSDKDRNQILSHVHSFAAKPLVSILMPTFNTPVLWLERAIQSVEKQLYPYWELCIADDASTEESTLRYLSELKNRDARIKITHRKENGHISAASNTALEMATGEYVAILDHDDELSPLALYHVVRKINETPTVQFLYSDEDKIDTKGRRFLPHFKGDWNPELFYSYNHITHFAVLKTSLVKDVGGFRTGFEGSQDYDLFLRCIEKISPSEVVHIPHILYHWRVLDTSTSGHSSAKPYAKDAAIKALNEHLKRTSTPAKVAEGFNDCFRIRYLLPNPLPKVSAIICTRDRVDLLKTVVDGLKTGTDYPNLEIIIVDNQSREVATLNYFAQLEAEGAARLVRYDHEFNFAAMNNMASRLATGELLAFLNNDLEIRHPEWLKEMVSFAVQPKIGAVGAKLLYPSGRLQHGGVILGIGGVAGHSHKGLGRHQNDFYARTHVSQCVSAVTAACLVIRKSIFNEATGFDDKHLTVAFNDVDFCLKVRELGYFNVWTPYAELTHHESESRGSDQRPETLPRFRKEEAFMKNKWGSILKRDPYYNPNLTLERENFDLAYPPRMQRPWRQNSKITESRLN